MELEIAILLALLGLFGSIVNTVTGGGGGVILIPILILLFDLPPSNAIATSFVAVTVGAVASTLAYSVQKTVNYRAGFALGLLTLPGAFIGAFATELVPSRAFNSILGFAIILFAVFVWFKRSSHTGVTAHSDTSANETSAYAVNMKVAYLFAVLTGFFSGTFGAGGGLIITPAMVLAGIPVHVAVGTSRLIALILAAGASATRVSLGQVKMGYVMWLAAGSAGGALIGARAVRLMTSHTLTRLVTLLISTLGLALVLNSLF